MIALNLSTTCLLRATTWHVTANVGQPEDRVGAIAAEAASGDTILIEPGTYYEHIPLEGKSLTFIGTGGASTTVLDGSRELTDREGSIVYTLTGASADLTLEGLTFRNGTGAPLGWLGDDIGGGAVLWWESDWEYAKCLAIRDCVFEDNASGSPYNAYSSGGGAISATLLDQVLVQDCVFTGNSDLNFGGDLFLLAETANVLQSDFDLAGGGHSGGASLHCPSGGMLRVQDCVFESETGDGLSHGLRAFPRRTELLNCKFLDHGGPLATRICLCLTEAAGEPPSDVLVTGCTFWNATGPDSAADDGLLDVYSPGSGECEITGNTFVRCGLDIEFHTGGSPMVFERNTIARGRVLFWIGSGGDYSCNNFWRSSVNDRIGNLSESNNITNDPLFCGEAGGDFTLSVGSPCAPYSAPNEECDLIGAWPVACELDLHACCVGSECQLLTEEGCQEAGGVWKSTLDSCTPDPCNTPVQQTSWGAIKARFRD